MKLLIFLTMLLSIANAQNFFNSKEGCLNLNDLCINSYYGLEDNILSFKLRKIKNKNFYISPVFSIAGIKNFTILTHLEKNKSPQSILINTQFKKGFIYNKQIIFPKSILLTNSNFLEIFSEIESNVMKCLQIKECKDSLYDKKTGKTTTEIQSKTTLDTQGETKTDTKGKQSKNDVVSTNEHIYKIKNLRIKVIVNDKNISLEWIDINNPFKINKEQELK